jgi:ribosomal protein S18 acetylase RimI-like enzyme
MTGVTYSTMGDHTHADLVCEMMGALYAEDAPAPGCPPRNFRVTIDHLLAHPDRGRVVLIAEGSSVCGYALLIPFWSNEFGGIVVHVDELFVVPAARGRGIGGGLFAMVEQQRPFDAVAVLLEVSPTNGRARRLYESLGFHERANRTLAIRLPNAAATLPLRVGMEDEDDEEPRH